MLHGFKSCGLSEYEYMSDYLPNIAKCLPLSLSDTKMNPVLEVLSGKGFVFTGMRSSAVCFVSADV